MRKTTYTQSAHTRDLTRLPADAAAADNGLAGLSGVASADRNLHGTSFHSSRARVLLLWARKSPQRMVQSFARTRVHVSVALL